MYMQVDLNCGKILRLVPALSTNTRLGCKRMIVTYTLAYYTKDLIASIESFIINLSEFQFSKHLGWFQPYPQILDFG